MTGADRMRRSRELQRRGAYHVDFVLAQDARMRLIEAEWLRRTDRDDKAAITAAVVACLTQTLDAQRGETEVLIDEATAGRVKAPAAREEGPGLSIARNGKETTPRPSQRPEKAAALAAYRDMLRGAELPGDLMAQATAADLDAARTSILDFVATASTAGGFGRWAENQRQETLRHWQLLQSFPDKLAGEYGIPFLERAIRDREEREATAAKAARLADGVELGEIELSGNTICQLVDRNFLSAENNRKDRKALTAAALRAVETALDLPWDRLPPPFAVETGRSSPRAAAVVRNTTLMALREALHGAPAEYAAEIEATIDKAERAHAAKIEQLARSASISPKLPAELVRRLVDRQFLAFEDCETPGAVRAAFCRAIALGLNPPPPPPPPRMTPVEISLATIAMNAFQRRVK
jgi:phenylpyruvate tautomerase PptA (4-oxalocrotonate tautomerase family)